MRAKVIAHISSFFLLLFFFSPVSAQANSPGETITLVVEQVRTAVETQEGKIPAEELEKQLHDIIAPVFDFKSMARSSLAKYWKEATPEQRTEFVDLFSNLLATTYLKRIRANATESEVSLVGEKMKGKKAIVKYIDRIKQSSRLEQNSHTTADLFTIAPSSCLSHRLPIYNYFSGI